MLLSQRDISYVLDCLDLQSALREKLRGCVETSCRLSTAESMQLGAAARCRLEISGFDSNYDPYGEARYLESLVEAANGIGPEAS